MYCDIIWNFFLSHSDKLGLTLTLFGTLSIVFFIGKDKNEWVEGEGKSRKQYSLLIKYPRLFYVGIVLIIIGFALSLFNSLLE